MSRISDLAGFTTALSTTEDLSVGIITASSFSGNLTGDVTGTATNASGLTGTPNITVGSVTAASGAFSGNVSVGGTLTYQDVSHIDAVGIITAQQGIQVLANGLDVTGVSTFKSNVSIADSILHTGDTDTSIRFPSTGTFTINTEGTERLRVTSTGLIGIGNENPNAELSVNNATANASVEITRGSSGAEYGYRLFGSDGATSSALKFFPVSNGSLGSEVVRFDASGNVLVAKTTTALTTAGSRLSSGFVSLSGVSSSTNLAANAGGALSLANLNSTDNNFSNIGGYNSNGLVVSQIDFINKSHSSRTGDIAFLTHNGSAMSEKMRITSGGGIHFNNGELLERINITAGKLSDNTNIDLEDGMAHLFTTTETTTATPNIRVNSSTTLNSVMATGDAISVTIITTAAAAGYSAQLTIDGVAVTEKWNGGSAPSAGGSSGNDYYTYNIIKTGDAAYTVLANVANFA